jgi:glycosyltransferase involved in cell wall biosynthesis
MRIAFIVGFAWEPKGTVRVRAYPLAVALANRGHEVSIFLTPYDNPAESGREFVSEGVHVKNLDLGHAGRASYPALLARLSRAVDHYRPDVVHVFKPKGFAGAACSYLLLKGFQPLVLDCDDWEGWGGWNDMVHYPWAVKQYIDWQEKWLIRRTPVVTVASRTLEKRATVLRSGGDTVVYVPNCGVSAQQVAVQGTVLKLPRTVLRQSFGLPDRPLVLYAGHFQPGENAMTFCRVAGPVAQRMNAALLLVGDGPELGSVKEFLSRIRSLDCRFFPRLPYEEFLRLVAASDVAFFPYPDDPIHRSKCSARMIDYLTMGKAVLTTSVGQNLEYIVHGVNGLLAPPEDEARMAEELEKLIKDPELRARLGSRAQEFLRGEFSWERSPAESCESAYGRLAK